MSFELSPFFAKHGSVLGFCWHQTEADWREWLAYHLNPPHNPPHCAVHLSVMCVILHSEIQKASAADGLIKKASLAFQKSSHHSPHPSPSTTGGQWWAEPGWTGPTGQRSASTRTTWCRRWWAACWGRWSTGWWSSTWQTGSLLSRCWRT